MAPPPVPETVLKRRKRDEAWAADRAAAAAKARSARSASRADAFKRAESYVKEYRAQVSIVGRERGGGGGGAGGRPDLAAGRSLDPWRRRAALGRRRDGSSCHRAPPGGGSGPRERRCGLRRAGRPPRRKAWAAAGTLPAPAPA
jgi:hypothetical protein